MPGRTGAPALWRMWNGQRVGIMNMAPAYSGFRVVPIIPFQAEGAMTMSTHAEDLKRLIDEYRQFLWPPYTRPTKIEVINDFMIKNLGFALDYQFGPGNWNVSVFRVWHESTDTRTHENVDFDVTRPITKRIKATVMPISSNSVEAKVFSWRSGSRRQIGGAKGTWREYYGGVLGGDTMFAIDTYESSIYSAGI